MEILKNLKNRGKIKIKVLVHLKCDFILEDKDKNPVAGHHFKGEGNLDYGSMKNIISLEEFLKAGFILHHKGRGSLCENVF